MRMKKLKLVNHSSFMHGFCNLFPIELYALQIIVYRGFRIYL